MPVCADWCLNLWHTWAGFSMRQYLHQRNGVWHYRRRVPSDLAHLDPRGEVRVTTKKRDVVEAAIVAKRVNGELEAFWAALSDGVQGPARDGAAERFERAVGLARTLGVPYRPAGDLAHDAGEIVRRLELLEARQLTGSRAAVEAVLGGAPKPALVMSQVFAAYEEHARDRLRGKSGDQVRKWRNPRLRAVANFLAVIGDKPLAGITRDDALDFRAWWLDRVQDDGMDPGSANKDLGHLAKMIGALNDAWRLGLQNPFSGLRLAGERHNPRTAYDADYVRAHFLAEGALASLNAEARGITVMVAATGMRPSEVAGLAAERIRLDAPIPFVAVRPDGRQLKTRHSVRDMPLAGPSLRIMQKFSDGFPRYRESPDSLSAIVNKALGAAGLRPTPGHTLYSLRHTFKDRLIAIEAPPRVQDALMGHAVGEIEYGAGPSLEQRAAWLTRVWG